MFTGVSCEHALQDSNRLASAADPRASGEWDLGMLPTISRQQALGLETGRS